MTVERKEPSLSDLGSLRDEPEVSTPRASANRKAPAPRSGYQDEPPARRPAPESRNSSRSPWLPVALLLAVAGLGVAGFSCWQLMQLQQQSAVSEKRLAELEQRLALSDDESTQSVSTLQANLRETRQQLDAANGEIRKLWDARNANRTAIADNKTQITAAAKAAQNAASAAAEAKKLAQAHDATMKTLSNNVALQIEQVGLLNDAATVQKKQVREAIDKANAVDTQLKQLRTDLAGRVKRSEDAIEAIDAHRVTVNRDILELKRRLNAE